VKLEKYVELQVEMDRGSIGANWRHSQILESYQQTIHEGAEKYTNMSQRYSCSVVLRNRFKEFANSIRSVDWRLKSSILPLRICK
jgi:hypothetical protein